MRLLLVACKVLQKESYFCAAKSKNVVDIKFLKQGLHNEPEKLREQVSEAVNEVEDVDGNKYDAVLLGYGLCSNGIVGVSSSVPLVVPRGHDCITLLLGSKERYQDYFDSHKGIYWYSNGWIATNTQPGKERYEKVFREYAEKYGEDNAQYLMEMEQNWMKEYKRATYIDWELGGSEDEKKYTKECADFLHWEYDELKGDISLMQKMVNAEWDEKEFLVLKPGQKIAEDLTSDGLIKAE